MSWTVRGSSSRRAGSSAPSRLNGRPDGALIVAAWPHTPVRPTGMWYDRWFGLLGLRLPNGLYRLGHAGCLLVSERTGRAHYFDCGRYECPPGMCRIRDDIRDPDVALSARARFAADGSLSNAEELLRELAGMDATHGEGVMVASVVGGLRFDEAYRKATGLQGRLYPFRHLAIRSLNCTRFLLQVTRFAEASWIVRLLERCAWLAGPSTLFLARMASGGSPVYLVDRGRISRSGRWSRLLKDRAFSPCSPQRGGPDTGREVPTPPSHRRFCLPSEARWLRGTAGGKWVALTHEPRLGPREFRFRRWSESGQQDCDRTFVLTEGSELDLLRPFELGYPTDCQECTIRQDERRSHLKRR